MSNSNNGGGMGFGGLVLAICLAIFIMFVL